MGFVREIRDISKEIRYVMKRTILNIVRKSAIYISIVIVICFAISVYCGKDIIHSPISKLDGIEEGSTFLLSDYFTFAWNRVVISQRAMYDEFFDYNAYNKYSKSSLADFHGTMIFYFDENPIYAFSYLGSNLKAGTGRAVFSKNGNELPNHIVLSNHARFRFEIVDESDSNYILIEC